MTDERKMQLIREIVPGDERVTGSEFLERLLNKLAAARNKQDEQDLLDLGEQWLETIPKEEIERWRASRPSPEVLQKRFEERCEGCSLNVATGKRAAITCRNCKAIREEILKEYAETHKNEFSAFSAVLKKGDGKAPNLPHIGRESETDISPRSREKAERSGKKSLSEQINGNKKNSAFIAELFNVRTGAYLTQSEKKLHPNAEYFTAERAVTDEEKAAGIKRVSLAFRKIVTVKNGAVVDCVKSGYECPLVAAIRNGKTVLLGSGKGNFGDELLGVCVRVILHYEG